MHWYSVGKSLLRTMYNSRQGLADLIVNGPPGAHFVIIQIESQPHNLGFASIGLYSTEGRDFAERAVDYAKSTLKWLAE